MPLYEYSCEQCGKKIELLVRGGEQPECPYCQSTQLTKLLSMVAGHVAGGSDTAAMVAHPEGSKPPLAAVQIGKGIPKHLKRT